MKKLLIFALVVGGIFYFIQQNVTPASILQMAKDRPSETWSPRTEYWLGVYHYTQNRYPDSEEAFTQLLTDYPSSYYAPEARIKLAMDYEAAMDRDKSLEQYKKYLEDYPDGPQAPLARKNADMLINR